MKFKHLTRYKLCYVDSHFAYFTTQSLGKQWGDYWDDIPYEHNAGEPYQYLPLVDSVNNEPWEVVKVAFTLGSYFMQPCHGHSNSPYSVRDINKKVVPWLIFYNYSLAKEEQEISLFAGTTLDIFIEEVMDAGGEVYLPMKESFIKTEIVCKAGASAIELVRCTVPTQVRIIDKLDNDLSDEPFLCPMGVYHTA